MKKTLTELQNKVLEAAKKRMRKEDWFSGVCVDNFPEDEEIRENFRDAVNSVCLTTAMWDDPDFFLKR